MAFKTWCFWWSWFSRQKWFNVRILCDWRNKSCKLIWISLIAIPELWIIAIRDAHKKMTQASSDDRVPHCSKMPRFISAKFSTLSGVVNCWSTKRWSHIVAWMITSHRCATSQVLSRFLNSTRSLFFFFKVLAWCFTCVPMTLFNVAWEDHFLSEWLKVADTQIPWLRMLPWPVADTQIPWLRMLPWPVLPVLPGKDMPSDTRRKEKRKRNRLRSLVLSDFHAFAFLSDTLRPNEFYSFFFFEVHTELLSVQPCDPWVWCFTLLWQLMQPFLPSKISVLVWPVKDFIYLSGFKVSAETTMGSRRLSDVRCVASVGSNT